ncbi:MAG TPA: hypothetical protein VGO01_12495 [Bradyrhizobium sp.]|jgi:hypothetical protein|nr:hypothetical protein [Bradyrhizobium sp.]
MHHPTTRAPALARNPSCSTASASRRSSGGLVLACVILAACAVTGSSLSALEGDQKPAPKKEPAKATVTGAKSAAAPAALLAAVPDLLQRRRQGIAEMLEGHYSIRGLLAGGAAKISEARLAGPFEYTTKSMFSSETKTQTLYCAEVKLALPLSPGTDVLVRVEHPAEGGERMVMTFSRYFPSQCGKVDWKPFPEIVQLRTQRRRALGNAD